MNRIDATIELADRVIAGARACSQAEARELLESLRAAYKGLASDAQRCTVKQELQSGPNTHS